MPGRTPEELESLVEYLKEEVDRLEEENARLSAIAAEPLRKAEEVLVTHGRGLSHAEVRKLLAGQNIEEPIIEHVISQITHVLKKVKKGSVLSWDAERDDKKP